MIIVVSLRPPARRIAVSTVAAVTTAMTTAMASAMTSAAFAVAVAAVSLSWPSPARAAPTAQVTDSGPAKRPAVPVIAHAAGSASDAGPAKRASSDAASTDAATIDAATAVAATAEGEPETLTVAATAIDEAFVAARRAMVAGDLDRFDRAVATIPRDHRLIAYVDYWRLRILLGSKRIEGLTGEADHAVRAFLARHPGSLVADLLRRDWLLALGRRGDWPTFDVEYPKWLLRDETGPDCYAQVSALNRAPLGRPLPVRIGSAARALVMRPAALARPCADLFDALVATGELKPVEIRRRLLLALEANAPADIRQALAAVGGVPMDRTLDGALARPAAALKSALHKDLRLVALVRLARADPAAAAARVGEAGPAGSGALSADDRRFVWSQIAASGMRRLAPEAADWSRAADGATISDDTRAWLVRAALREQDWRRVRAMILAMTEPTRGEPTWTYWLARANQALGRTDEARAAFEALAVRRDYYGKLAAEDLGRRITAPPRPDAPTPARVAEFDESPAFARAIEFYRLGLRFEGNREWNFELRGRPDTELRAAAVWAVNRGLLDRAINADERIRTDADFALRFPTPHADALLPITRQHDLDAAWVYGLIRQESRFIQDARSHVGASGLMQLMPATARWVARKLGRSDFHPRDVNDLQTNLTFGSYYLKAALDDLDGSAVLASAGYNAGPGRARTWRATLTSPLEGAIFAELIPFTETRGYVKHVLSNSTDYAALFSGESQSLKARLGTIAPKPAGTTALP